MRGLSGPAVGLTPGVGSVIGNIAFGILWLVATVGFVASGLGPMLGRSKWWPTVLGVAPLSLFLCIFGWSDAWFGVLLDVAILASVLDWPLVPCAVTRR
jgi:hypothetical protein